MPTLDSKSRLAIKPGVAIRTLGLQFISCETPDPDRNLVLPTRYLDVDLLSLIKLLDGTRSLGEISTLTGMPQSDLATLMQKLADHSLLDTMRSPLPYLNRYNSQSQRIEEVYDVEKLPADPAITTYLQRCEVESSAMTFHSGVVDGGRSALLARRELSIEILGSDRLSIALGGTLIASGFEQTTYSDRAKQMRPTSSSITSEDLVGSLFRASDLGMKKRERFFQLVEESSLFPMSDRERRFKERKVSLVIATENPAPEEQQRWMSEGISHIALAKEPGGTLRIGPFVEPGRSPCLRCIDLTENKSEPIRKSPDCETSIALLSLVTGVLASDIANLAIGARSVFWATTIRYSLREFIAPQIHRWQPHPACGCFWN